MPLIRLDKLLSEQGICMRSEVRGLLRKGTVTVDGRPVKDSGLKIDAETSVISVGGRRISYKKHLYLMMNKPGGVLSASRDPKQPTVLDLLPEEIRRPGLFPAGRLDKDTEGLLIITDDGVFAHEILSPRKHVRKRYYAGTDRSPEPEDIEAFRSGIALDDGTVFRPAELEPAEGGALVTISEGKYHQVKRMLAARGMEVLFLKRLSVGALPLDETLVPGDFREITAEELRRVKMDR